MQDDDIDDNPDSSSDDNPDSSSDDNSSSDDDDSTCDVDDSSFGDATNTTAVSNIPDVSVSVDASFQEPTPVLEEFGCFMQDMPI